MDFFKKYNYLLPWLLAYAAVLLYFKFEYLSVRLFFFGGLALAPLLVRKVSEERSWRFGGWALAVGAVLIFERSNMAYYFCAGFGLLFLVETSWGKLNWLPVFLWVVISPVFQYVAEVWSFPIRLEMSELAAKSLRLAGYEAQAFGNVISLGGAEFSVDPACMGLNLLSTSLLLGLLILAHFERRRGVVFSFWETAAWLALALALSIFSNFNRLLTLVLFKVMPGEPMHEVWGLIGLGIYVLLPFYFLVRWRTRRSYLLRRLVLNFNPQLQLWGFSDKAPNTTVSTVLALKTDKSVGKMPVAKAPQLKLWVEKLEQIGSEVAPVLKTTLLAWLIFTADAPDHQPVFQNANLQTFQLPGFQTSLTENGMLKLENDSALIYIKPPSGFLRASHDPRICWQGSGYEFSRIQKERLGEVEIYTAILAKGNDRLHTCWWYENGKTRTVEEWNWRWAGLLGGGGGFQLMNVTCKDRAVLLRQAKSIQSFHGIISNHSNQ